MTPELTDKTAATLRLIAQYELNRHDLREDDLYFPAMPMNPQIKALTTRGYIVAVGFAKWKRGGEQFRITEAGKKALTQAPRRFHTGYVAGMALEPLLRLEAEIGAHDWLAEAIKQIRELYSAKEKQ